MKKVFLYLASLFKTEEEKLAVDFDAIMKEAAIEKAKIESLSLHAKDELDNELKSLFAKAEAEADRIKAGGLLSLNRILDVAQVDKAKLEALPTEAKAKLSHEVKEILLKAASKVS